MINTRSPSVLMINLTRIGQGEGGALHQTALAEYFISAGARVEMLVPRSKTSNTENLPHYIVRTPSLGRFLPATFDSIGQIPAVILRCIRRKPDSVYIRADSLSWLPAAVARLFGCRVIMEHNGWLETERRLRGGSNIAAFIDRCFQLLCARTAHTSRTVTDGLKRHLVSGGINENKVCVIGNGTDMQTFFKMDRTTCLKELGWAPAVRRVGFIGGLAAWHGVCTAVRAFAILKDDPRLKLVIAGDGPQKRDLIKLTQELGIEDRVDFLGYVPRAKANLVINGFDLAIAPFTAAYSRDIGLSSIKIRDYAAAGRPVVASRVEGITELAGNGWLTLHEADNAADLARAIREHFEPGFDLEQAGYRASEFARENFSWEIIAADVYTLISRNQREC